MPDNEVERLTLIHEWPPVRGLQVVVAETVESPRTVSLVITGTAEGVTDVTEIDGTDPGAKARAVSLGEIIHDALVTAEMTWFPFDEADA